MTRVTSGLKGLIYILLVTYTAPVPEKQTVTNIILTIHQQITLWTVMNLKRLKYFYINHGDQRFFESEIIINVLVGSFRFI